MNDNFQDSISLAGWLFADLLLGLSVIFLIATSHFIEKGGEYTKQEKIENITSTQTIISSLLESTITPTKAIITPTITATENFLSNNDTLSENDTLLYVKTALESPTAEIMTVTPVEYNPPGLSPAQCYNVQLRSESFKDDGHVIKNTLMSKIPYGKGIRAGLVLIWVYGDTMRGSVEIAKRIGMLIIQAMPETFKGTEMKYLYFERGAINHAQIEVYYLSTHTAKSGKEDACLTGTSY